MRLSTVWTSIVNRFSLSQPERSSSIPEPQTLQADTPPPPDHPFIWEGSSQYRIIMNEGHQKPPPAFGSPTFIMHLGIWQKRQSDELDRVIDRVTEDPIKAKFSYFDEHNQRFFEEVNAFVVALQKKGRVLLNKPGMPQDKVADLNIDAFEFATPLRSYGSERREKRTGKSSFKFKTYNPQSVAFTLWWHDSDSEGNPLPNERVEHPKFSALRVRVQIQTHFDHVTISFFIDAAKPYGKPQIYAASDIPAQELGYRRTRIATYLNAIRQISESQIKSGHVEEDRLPEKGVAEPTAKLLLEAATYFYDGIWKDFMTSFGIEDLGLALRPKSTQEADDKVKAKADDDHREGERFADFRGVVMSMKGLETIPHLERRQHAQDLRKLLNVAESDPAKENERNANVGIGKLSTFDFDNNEPNTILKSLWPFLRRMTPWADYRDFIGCGLIGRRMLYVTPLGASGSFFADEEGPGRQNDISALHLPQEQEGKQTGVNTLRYLVLTRGEPHREQAGRFIDLINAVNVKRLFALKNLETVKNASIHLRLLGRELDGVLQKWGDERKNIDDWYQAEVAKLRIKEAPQQPSQSQTPSISHKIGMGGLSALLKSLDLDSVAKTLEADSQKQKIASKEEQELWDQRADKIAALLKDVEQSLVKIGAALDNIGNGGAGRILYVINRAKYHISEFDRMFKTLEITNIDGWINYKQFVQRRLMPTFGIIHSTGERLVSLRSRLQGVTEMIQTSALIVEAEATRTNTATLRRIAFNLYVVAIPTAVIAAWLIGDALEKISQNLMGQGAQTAWIDYIKVVTTSSAFALTSWQAWKEHKRR